uniref:Histone-lysine N-methyltransferase, H3 lysine-79 specific n=1 Tax=Phaeomonas parva TaxID=124430 RepID=A0A7S1U404_9STRA|mmetsp:Transcript_30378/g.96926  ORF Transcript_30378/g.96926 Transcript_30378/m.96926 type:complete len:248 (+) Transcript_30378:265-1008(+)
MSMFQASPEQEGEHSSNLANELAETYANMAQIEELDAWTAKALYDRLVEPFPEGLGKETSRAERQVQNLNSSTLVYGEITFDPFAEQLLKLQDFGGLAQQGGNFYDIGCGTGKPVFAAALLHRFDKCVGIEILSGLYGISMHIMDIWNTQVQPALPRTNQETEIGFIHGDATVLDWRDGDVVFMNSTCFGDELMETLAAQAEGLKPGAFVITTTRKLPSEEFELLHVSKMVETWGTATVFIHKRQGE